LGQMLVILTAGIDLSVGSLVKVSILVSAIVMNGESANVLPAILATLALGVLVGMIHGFLINELRIAPFIVTLASLVILKGIGLTISSSPVGKASREVMMFYVQKVGPLPVIALMFFMLVILTMLLLRYTVFGKHLVAVGGNIEVAHLSGVPVKRTRYAVYVLCSLTAAVTGLLWLSRMGVGDPAIGDGIELQTITAVIIGGTSLFGGRASVLGTLGGVLLLGISANLLVMLGVSQFIQGLIQGIIIVAAVALYKQEGD
ncbi:MAG: ABC transporter permease, partial [Chloroflexi bacterium]|nr:ABC transporter permease [Chloroflexota bacterium]